MVTTISVASREQCIAETRGSRHAPARNDDEHTH
jgi:hypothetical protein